MAEQVDALKQVLKEMSALGLDPAKLVFLSTRLYGDDISTKLAYFCADSPDWQSVIRSKGTGRERLLVTLLNQAAIFEPYNEAFRQYGVEIHATEAEKLGLMYFSRVRPRGAGDRRKARLLVPADAMLGLRFSPIESKSKGQ